MGGPNNDNQAQILGSDAARLLRLDKLLRLRTPYLSSHLHPLIGYSLLKRRENRPVCHSGRPLGASKAG